MSALGVQKKHMICVEARDEVEGSSQVKLLTFVTIVLHEAGELLSVLIRRCMCMIISERVCMCVAQLVINGPVSLAHTERGREVRQR